MSFFPNILVALILSSAVLRAGDFFVTPEGGGVRNGATWATAFDQGSVERVVNELMVPGDTLHLGGGVYRGLQVEVRRGGAEGRPISIVGVDRGGGLPVLRGEWSVEAPSEGGTAIRLSAGVSDVSFANLRIERFQTGVQARGGTKEGLHRRVAFRNIDMSRIRHGFYLSGCTDLLLADCDLRNYTKHGFRFESGCSLVRVLRCVADCSGGSDDWERRTELFPFGFFVNHAAEPHADFEFVDCVARNNLMPLQDRKYKNGDGFVVEKSAARVVFRRCRAIRNQDGGFDLKTPGVTLEDCVAVRNSRGIRIWGTGTLTNCFVGFGNVGLWANGGGIEVKRTTFHGLSGAAVLADDEAEGPVSLTGCLITRCGAPVRRTAKGRVEFADTVGADGEGDSVVFREPQHGWEGDGPGMDSISHPARGYVFPPDRGVD